MNNNNKLAPIPKKLVVTAWILVFGSIAPMLDSTMINIAINKLSQDFQVKLNIVQWTITGFMLAMGASVPFSGWLANKYSMKKVYVYAEAFFGITSLAAACSWNIQILIFFRILQGLSAGLIMTLFISVLVDLVGNNRIGRIMSIVGIPMTLGPMIGPIFAGLIIETASWRWLFLINVPISVIASILLILKVPDTKPKDNQAKIDFLGILYLVLTSISIVYGVVQASEQGSFSNPRTAGFIIFGIIILLVYLIHAVIRKEAAVIPVRLFKKRNFSGAMIGILFTSFITSGPMLLLPLFFQNIRGESAMMTAISLIPQSLGMLVSRGIVGRMIDSFGAKWVAIIGVLIAVITTLPFVYINNKTAYLYIAGLLFIRGIGGAAASNAIEADVFVGIRQKDTAVASMSSNLFQQIGNGFSSAVLATVVASYLNKYTATNIKLILTAYQTGFLVATVVALLTLIPAVMLTNKIKINSR